MIDSYICYWLLGQPEPMQAIQTLYTQLTGEEFDYQLSVWEAGAKIHNTVQYCSMQNGPYLYSQFMYYLHVDGKLRAHHFLQMQNIQHPIITYTIEEICQYFKSFQH